MYKDLYNEAMLKMLRKNAKEKLERFASYMPNGQYDRSDETGIDRCDAIGLQADGKIVALYSHGSFSAAQLKIVPKYIEDNRPNPVRMGGVVGAVFSPDYNYGTEVDWEASVIRYNKSLVTKSLAIVGIYTFDHKIPIEDIDITLINAYEQHGRCPSMLAEIGFPEKQLICQTMHDLANSSPEWKYTSIRDVDIHHVVGSNDFLSCYKMAVDWKSSEEAEPIVVTIRNRPYGDYTHTFIYLFCRGNEDPNTWRLFRATAAIQ